MNKVMKLLAVLAALGFAEQTLAQHSDIEIHVSGGVVSAESDELLLDAITGYRIFEGNFGDLAGGPYGTDDPGFVAEAGSFAAGTVVGYRAQGTLQYWNGSSWGMVAGQERVHITDAWGEDSIFALSGISGKSIGLIDQVSADGALHAHVDFSIENSLGTGNPLLGAYMIQLSLVALDESLNPLPAYAESTPFFLAFNRGLSAENFETAIDARVAAVPVPAAGPLLASALALGFGLARRRQLNLA